MHYPAIIKAQSLILAGDIEGLRRAMLDPTRDGQEMREVGPFVGLLPDEERRAVLAGVSR